MEADQEHLYQSAADQFGSALERLARAYEADAEKRRDLLQDIHFQVWRSFTRFDGRCSMRTWVYRVAHHVAASYVIRERRTFAALVSLEELEKLPDKDDAPDRQLNLERLDRLIQQLKPLDRQVIVCYLEDMDGASIAEITGFRAFTSERGDANSSDQERSGATVPRKRDPWEVILQRTIRNQSGRTNQRRHRE